MSQVTPLMEQVKSLVDISSGSHNPEGIRGVQERVLHWLKNDGARPRWIAPSTTSAIRAPHRGEILVGEWGNAPFVTLVTHADTVFEKESDFRGIKIDGEWAYGPGVIDDKGGIVVAVEGLRQFAAKGQKQGVRFICTPTEELGSPGFTEALAGISKDSKIILGFEPALGGGEIITSRQGNRWYRIHVQGKEAHAGRDHKRGINAAHELCMKLDQLQKLTNYKRGLTVSIGSMTGGTGKYNIVCGEAEGRVDVRFGTFQTRDQAHRKIAALLKRTHVKGAHTDWELTDDCPPLEFSKKSQAYVKRYVECLKRAGQKKPKVAASGGSSDCNYVSRAGLVMVDGLGPMGSGLHTEQERLWMPSLALRSEALGTFLKELE